MHTILVVSGGFVLLVVFTLLARWRGAGNRSAIAKAALAFIPVWFVAAAINMWVGVTQAGYTVAEEAPILGLVFGVPAIVALFVWRRFSRDQTMNN